MKSIQKSSRFHDISTGNLKKKWFLHFPGCTHFVSTIDDRPTDESFSLKFLYIVHVHSSDDRMERNVWCASMTTGKRLNSSHTKIPHENRLIIKNDDSNIHCVSCVFFVLYSRQPDDVCCFAFAKRKQMHWIVVCMCVVHHFISFISPLCKLWFSILLHRFLAHSTSYIWCRSEQPFGTNKPTEFCVVIHQMAKFSRFLRWWRRNKAQSSLYEQWTQTDAHRCRLFTHKRHNRRALIWKWIFQPFNRSSDPSEVKSNKEIRIYRSHIDCTPRPLFHDKEWVRRLAVTIELCIGCQH